MGGLKYSPKAGGSWPKPQAGAGVLGILSDEDDHLMIFWGLKFSIPGFLGSMKMASIFLGSLI